MAKILEEMLPPTPAPTERVKRNVFKRIYRVIIDSVYGFIDDDCYTKASALAYFSVLSVVPLLAVIFGIAKGFGFQQTIENQIKYTFSDYPLVSDKLIEFSYSWLKSVQGGLIAGIGTIFLFWTVIGLLNNVEAALNSIWKTKISRSYYDKVTDYLAVMIIAPLFLVASSSMNVYLTTQIQETAHNYAIVGAVSPYLLFILKLFPYFLVWILFIFMYKFLPNTKVYLRSAVIAAILAGTVFQLWQYVYIKFQIGVSSYGAIYGSFAALPLFLVWIQISWLILLAGAEIAVQLENDLFMPNRVSLPVSIKNAALLITYRCIEAFVKGTHAPTDRTLAQELGMSLNHVHVIVEALNQAGILSVVSLPDKTFGYQPAKVVPSITIKTVDDAIDKSNEILASVIDTPAQKRFYEYEQKIDRILSEEKVDEPVYNA